VLLLWNIRIQESRSKIDKKNLSKEIIALERLLQKGVTRLIHRKFIEKFSRKNVTLLSFIEGKVIVLR